MEAVLLIGQMADELVRPIVTLLLLSCLLGAGLMGLLVRVLEVSTVRPFLHCRPSSLSRHLIDNLARINRPYTLPRWCGPAHGVLSKKMANIVAHVVNQLCPTRPVAPVFLHREFLEVERGQVSLDWTSRAIVPPFKSGSDNDCGCCFSGQVIAVVVPGPWLCDSPSSLMPLCQALMETAVGEHSSFIRPVIFNARRCDSWLAATTTFGDTTNLHRALQYLQSQHPRATLVAVGFSYGASLVVSYLGEYGHSSLIKAGVAISPIWDLQTSLRQLNWPIKTWWKFKLETSYLSLLARFQDRQSSFPKKNSRSDCDTADDDNDGWPNHSPIRDADDIAVPLLVIHYQDDPLVTEDTLPSELFSLYPHLLLLMCPAGGHCGLLQRIECITTVAEDVASDFIHHILVVTDALKTKQRPPQAQQSLPFITSRYRSPSVPRQSRNPSSRSLFDSSS